MLARLASPGTLAKSKLGAGRNNSLVLTSEHRRPLVKARRHAKRPEKHSQLQPATLSTPRFHPEGLRLDVNKVASA